ncbi:MAG: tRNA (guanosine(46)-N7)-methyltransferase TrmB [Prochlorococcus sp. SP3034]|nr:tRNA (guanosine(46)-N7)-methyltransferase TrmB [Prochlorococcus sp. SP3034]|tara:strand:- start:4841 stop:5470 length:630 start_codon:yes stop_codon:yes gene_type:complete
MRQHVNPLSNYYDQIIPIPLLNQVFKKPDLPLHLDLGAGSGDFLFKLAFQNQGWNYMGIEIREKLVIKARSRSTYKNLDNLFFAYGNANNLINDLIDNLSQIKFKSISVNFPDPWFKKKHHKRRIIQKEFINNLSLLMPSGSLIIIKSDVFKLFEFINFTILASKYFQKIDKDNLDLLDYFNPNKLQTEREIYALLNNLPVYENIYVRN